MKIDQIIIKPVITEKSTAMAKDNKYQFIVSDRSNKISIKQALKELYGEEVDTVRVLKVKSKTRRVKFGEMIKRPEQKKAIVSFKGNKTIDINKFKEKK